MDSDDTINLKACYFLPRVDVPSRTAGVSAAATSVQLVFNGGGGAADTLSDEQVAYARANTALIKTAPVWQHYHTGMTLGRGSFAAVKHGRRRAAHNPEIPQHVAIKVVDKARTEDLAALRREVSLMSALDHPNIIRLYEVFDSPRRLYLILELASGGDLFDRIVAQGSYTEADASKVARELLSALAYVHANGIIHRDLKPENLLYVSDAPDAPIKVADFGLAHRMRHTPTLSRENSSVSPNFLRLLRRADNDASPHAARSPKPCSTDASSPASPRNPLRVLLGRSASGAQPSAQRPDGWRSRQSCEPPLSSEQWLCGTPSYMAPEVVEHRRYGPACDLWATGVVLYISFKGEQPFAPSGARAMGRSHRDATFDAIRRGEYDACEGDAWAAVSEPAKDLIRQLLVNDDSARLSAQAALGHPWVADQSLAESGSFRLQDHGGIARLAEHREGTLLNPSFR